MSSALPLARVVANIAASIGVSRVVNDVIQNNTTVVTTADAVKVWTGAIVIGSLVADVAMKHVNERFDTAVTWNEKRKNKGKDGDGVAEKVADAARATADKVEDLKDEHFGPKPPPAPPATATP